MFVSWSWHAALCVACTWHERSPCFRNREGKHKQGGITGSEALGVNYGQVKKKKTLWEKAERTNFNLLLGCLAWLVLLVCCGMHSAGVIFWVWGDCAKHPVVEGIYLFIYLIFFFLFLFCFLVGRKTTHSCRKCCQRCTYSLGQRMLHLPLAFL